MPIVFLERTMARIKAVLEVGARLSDYLDVSIILCVR